MSRVEGKKMGTRLGDNVHALCIFGILQLWSSWVSGQEFVNVFAVCMDFCFNVNECVMELL